MAVNKKQQAQKISAPAKQKQSYRGFKETTTPMMYLIPFIGVLMLIPLIIRFKSFENNLTGEYWHSANLTSSDIFLYWKSVFIIAFGAILLFMLVMALLIETKKFKFEIEFAPLTVYLVFVLLSTFLSEHIYFSIHGIENHFESMWVLLAYIILAIYGVVMVDNTKAVKIVIYGWLIGTWGLLLIGVFQAFKLDIFTTQFIKYIIFPESMRDNNLRLNFDLGQVYITLYNPNYVGYFAAVTIPVFLTLAIYAKKYWQKALFALTVIGVFICSIGSGAKNGLLALAGAFLFLIIMFRKQLLKRWYVLVIAIVALVAVFFGINAVRGNAMINSIKLSLDTLKTKGADTRHLDGITCSETGINITYDEQTYMLTMSAGEGGSIGVIVTDSTGNKVPTKLSEDEQSIVSNDKSFPFTIKPVNYNISNTVVPSIQLTIDGFTYSFSNQLDLIAPGTTGYFYLNASGKWVNIEEAETALFTNNPKLFSNRGYIWARSIPLLKEHVFIGSGPDTFSFEFPNNDYVNSAYVGFLNQIVTKPHSLYLQIGVQTGVISLLAFIAFFLIYFVRTIMLYWKHPLDTIMSKLGIAICAGLLGYMISGITNDSTITYAPVFWALIGVGISINTIVRNEYAARPKEEAQN